MPFDEAQQPDFGGGGGRRLTPVGLMAQEFAAAWVKGMDSESEEVLEDAYAAWDHLQLELSVEVNDILLKLSAFKIRFGGSIITTDAMCENDALYLDTLATEALAVLFPQIDMDG